MKTENLLLIQQYFDKELEGEELNLFEKKLKDDDEFAKNVQQFASMIIGIRASEKNNKHYRKIGAINKLYFQRSTLAKVAAVILFVLGIASAIYFIHNENKKSLISEKKNEIASMQENKKIIPITIPKSELKNEGLPKSNDYGYVGYEESAVYENAIENSMRSEKLEMLSPIKSEKFIAGKSIIFKWEGDNPILQLTILSNKEKIIFEKMIHSHYQLPIKLKKGLYYWKFEDKNEIVYIGKFYVN